MLRLPRRNGYFPLFAAVLCACAATSAFAGAEPRSPRVEAIRFWSFGDVTRVAIETRGSYKIHTEQIERPARLFFDLRGLKPPAAQTKGVHSIQVGDQLVKQIRVAETTPGVTRVVFDLESPVEFTSSQLANPDRLVIEIRAKGPNAGALNVTRSQMGGKRFDDGSDAPVAGALPDFPADNPKTRSSTAFDLPARVQSPKQSPDLAALYPPPELPYQAPVLNPTLRAVLYGPLERLRSAPVPPYNGPAEARRADQAGTRRADPAGTRKDAARTAPLPPDKIAPAVDLPTLDGPMPIVKPAAAAAVTASNAGPASAPAKIDSSGNRSLVRVFGLKLGKIVIDAGHGGNDTGTIGPHGLLEKELVLDVALRLGQLIQTKLGSQVVYTRSDDTFIPLEQRTKIANDEKADLFISIHANSAPIANATGVETYYFNFTTEKTALDLATRENATAESSIHELNDLLQQAVLKAKVEESREFAQKVQGSLYGMSAKMNSRARDRGVRKAPFVVLIGATMPSILAEVGFVNNPHDEPLLKKADQRQKIAEALFKGIEQYSNTLSHVQMARVKSEGQ